jgi:hypothetical protein
MIAIVFILGLFSPAGAEKPKPPLNLKLTVDTEVTVGDAVQMTLSVVPRHDSGRLEISVELPEGIAHVSGPLAWTGPAVKDRAVSIQFEVRLPEAGSYTVRGRGSITLSNGSTWTQPISARLDPTTTPVRSEKPASRLRRDRDGRTVIEIPAR